LNGWNSRQRGDDRSVLFVSTGGLETMPRSVTGILIVVVLVLLIVFLLQRT
jgi:hypothetical protein